ncbi:MAG: enoyl-CoA hydratase/isomerase family protein [Proteobacteria bacterium]|nr:enoyl-CoA hydratase/isomerase family protein [Pseudomonadota bacterium]
MMFETKSAEAPHDGAGSASIALPPLALPLAQDKTDPRVVISTASATLLDIGDGVSCLVFHSKLNTINAEITALIRQSLEVTAAKFDALVIANGAAHFSAGADIRDFLVAIRGKDWACIDQMETEFQGLMQELKCAKFPVVSCPVGMTFGAGCEISLHATLRVASIHTKAGLVEANVGLFPAGGGTKELALRAYARATDDAGEGPMPYLRQVFNLISAAKTSATAQEAIDMGLFPVATTGIEATRELVAPRAKQAALALIPGFVATSRHNTIRAVGQAGIQRFKADLEQSVEAGRISLYDAVIGEKIATVLCGGDVEAGTLVSEQRLLDLERGLFVELCQQPNTLERIESMLKHGKPLRN